jgi:cbb3-type cytochrome oxidase maturation protein
LEHTVSKALENSGKSKADDANASISIEETILLDVDILIYIIGSIIMACISVGFVLWGLKSGQFEENEHVKRQPLEEDEEEK